MRNHQRQIWTTLACGLLGALLGAVIWQGLVQPAPAYGQIPDAGAQRKEMIQELQTVNKKLSEVAGLLKELRDLAKEKSKP